MPLAEEAEKINGKEIECFKTYQHKIKKWEKRTSESFCGRNFISHYYAGNRSGCGYPCKIGMDGNGICCVVTGIIFCSSEKGELTDKKYRKAYVLYFV